MFIPNQNVNFYNTFDPISNKSLKKILTKQIKYYYYPIHESELKTNINYQTLNNNQKIHIDSTTITPILMNHPILNFKYLIKTNNQKMFFTNNHEPLKNIYNPNDPKYIKYNKLIQLQNNSIKNHIKKIDLIITNTMYTTKKYPNKIN